MLLRKTLVATTMATTVALTAAATTASAAPAPAPVADAATTAQETPKLTVRWTVDGLSFTASGTATPGTEVELQHQGTPGQWYTRERKKVGAEGRYTLTSRHHESSIIVRVQLRT